MAIGINTSAATFAARSALELDHTPTNPIEWGIVVANLGCVVLSAVVAKSKIDLRDRLESNLSENGFNERVMKTTVGTYCTRQATKVACENTGHSEEYATLLKEDPKVGDFRWLPHI